MLKKSIYLFILSLTISVLSMEEDIFYDAIEPEESIELPQRGTDNFIDMSEIMEIVQKFQSQIANTAPEMASIDNLPAEILVKILIILTNAKTPKEAVQAIINFSGTGKTYNQFVKACLPDLLRIVIDKNKKFTIKEFLSANLLPIILTNAFKKYFAKKSSRQQLKNVQDLIEIQSLINDIKNNIKTEPLTKENKYILANLYFLKLLTKEDKNNLLLLASSYGSKSVIEILLEIGAEPNIQNRLKFDATELFQLDNNKFYTYFNKPISISAYDEPNIMGGLFDCGYTPLMLIIIKPEISFDQKKKIIKNFLEHRADINKQSKLKGHTALMLAVLKNDNEMVKFLLNNGADKEIQDYCGHTAFEIAQAFGFKPIIDLLLEKKQTIDNNGKNWIALWTMLFESISVFQLQDIFGLEEFINNILENPKIINNTNAQNIIANLSSEQQELIYAILNIYHEEEQKNNLI